MVRSTSESLRYLSLKTSQFLFQLSSKTFAMSNTELVTVALPQSVTAPSAFDVSERASPRPQDVEGEPTNGRRTEQELAPVDGGSAAWSLLCAAFVFETLLWGKLLSYIEFNG
jgi:hypothetical protein